jgi:hypothetical protein
VFNSNDWHSRINPKHLAGVEAPSRGKQTLRILRPVVEADGVPPATQLAASAFATMLFPGDSEEELRKRWSLSHVLALGFRAWRTGDLTLDSQVLKSELIASRAQIFVALDFVRRCSWGEVIERWRRGLVVGDVLRLLIAMHKEEHGSASLERAYFALDKQHRRPDAPSDRRRVGRTTIATYWAELRTVSHWWAGFADFTKDLKTLMERDPEPADSTDVNGIALESLLHSPDHIICRSRDYLRCVQAIAPKHSRDTDALLVWHDAWLAPIESIPADCPEFLDPEKSVAGLDEFMKGVLAGYRDRRQRPTSSK